MPRNDTNKNSYELIVNLENLEELVESKRQQQEKDKMKAIGKFVKTQIISPVIHTTTNIIGTQINTISGQEQLSQRWQFMLNSFNTGAEIAQVMTGGAVFAKVFGASVGTGAGIGLALFGLQKTLSFVEEGVRIQALKSVEQKQLEQTRERAGWAFNKTRQGV